MKIIASVMTGVLAAFGMANACAAGAVELPARRSGYWEISIAHTVPAGGPEMLAHACIDSASDKAMMEAGMSAMQSMCTRQELKREGEAYVWDTDCTMGPMKSKSHTVASGDFKSAYSMKISGDVTGMPMGGDAPMKTEMTQNAKWIAEACPAGVKPGDMEMPGGMKINVHEIMKTLGGEK